jgi:D-lactate dehydrogenase
MLNNAYASFYQSLLAVIPSERMFHDELHTLAYGTDASFYRLIPKLVIKAESEDEVVTILRHARRNRLPLTFRAAGTSLSGQAISDSVLVLLGQGWNRWSIVDDASKIRLQPGIIGGHANIFLAPYGKKIGPDPASINAAMIGGIAANNASGMCCGTAQNSYRTLAAMRIIFADGTLLDTADPASVRQFGVTHSGMLAQISALSARLKTNAPLADRVRRKFKMKNTTGYSLNALVDFEDPVQIIQHLMIGSEGTLGFIAEVTYHTVPEHPHKASALMLFPDIRTACTAVSILKQAPVDAVELMDRAALRSVENKAGMPDYLKELGPEVASLLVETRAPAADLLSAQMAEITRILENIPKVRPLTFTSKPAEFSVLWNIRKGLFPSVGAMRRSGTTVIIEDVAFPVPRLAEATLDLQALLRKHAYNEAIIFGHALEGNLHFVFTQEFTTASEVQRYQGLIDDVTDMVVRVYDGSLKAEHGTGRNMAPFVELEWGAEAYALMQEIKAIFDPEGLLNPGVILNPDPRAHLKDFKPMPEVDSIIDKCIECGFCEVQCPSRTLTLTPRQRIVTLREMARLRATHENPARLAALQEAFQYDGDATCATDGLCAISCPVEIDTGKMIKDLRLHQHGSSANGIATLLSEHMGAVTGTMRVALNFVHLAHKILGTKAMGSVARGLRSLSGKTIPLWNPAMPRGVDRLSRTNITHGTGRIRGATMAPAAGTATHAATREVAAAPQVNAGATKSSPAVVYFPSCINRAMGPAKDDADQRSLTTVVVELLHRAGFDVILPDHLDELCCGMAFASKGFKKQGDAKAKELEEELLKVSRNGALPVLVDMSPCLYRMKETFTSDLRLMEPVQFILEHAVPHLQFHKQPITVAVHTTCSAEKMGLAGSLKAVAELCAERVIVPQGVGCCGWAGDRGFTVPELNAAALAPLREAIPGGCEGGYSTSRTCEIGLSVHSGVQYQSIVYLVEKATRP